MRQDHRVTTRVPLEHIARILPSVHGYFYHSADIDGDSLLVTYQRDEVSRCEKLAWFSTGLTSRCSREADHEGRHAFDVPLGVGMVGVD